MKELSECWVLNECGKKLTDNKGKGNLFNFCLVQPFLTKSSCSIRQL